MVLPDIKGKNKEEIELANKIRDKLIEILKTDNSKEEDELFNFLMSQITDSKFFINRKYILKMKKEGINLKEHSELFKELVDIAENRLCIFCNHKIDGKGIVYKMKHEGQKIEALFHIECFEAVNNIVDNYCEKNNIPILPLLKGEGEEIKAANKIRDNFIKIIQSEDEEDQSFLLDLVNKIEDAQWYMLRRCIFNINHEKINEKRKERFLSKLNNFMFLGYKYCEYCGEQIEDSEFFTNTAKDLYNKYNLHTKCHKIMREKECING